MEEVAEFVQGVREPSRGALTARPLERPFRLRGSEGPHVGPTLERRAGIRREAGCEEAQRGVIRCRRGAADGLCVLCVGAR